MLITQCIRGLGVLFGCVKVEDWLNYLDPCLRVVKGQEFQSEGLAVLFPFIYFFIGS